MSRKSENRRRQMLRYVVDAHVEPEAMHEIDPHLILAHTMRRARELPGPIMVDVVFGVEPGSRPYPGGSTVLVVRGERPIDLVIYPAHIDMISMETVGWAVKSRAQLRSLALLVTLVGDESDRYALVGVGAGDPAETVNEALDAAIASFMVPGDGDAPQIMFYEPSNQYTLADFAVAEQVGSALSRPGGNA